MNYKREDWEFFIRAACPDCANGIQLNYDERSDEFSHQTMQRPKSGTQVITTAYCLANNLRRAYREAFKNG